MKPSLRILCERYLRHAGIKPGSQDQYRIVCRLAVKWRGKPLSSTRFFRDRTLSRFQEWLGKGRSVETVRSKMTMVFVLWEYARKLQVRADIAQPSATRRVWCVESPLDSLLRRPKGVRHIVTAWTSAEVQAMLDHCHVASRRPGWDERNMRGLIGLLYYTGPRIRQTVALGKKALIGNTVFLPAEDAKEARDRVAEIPCELADLLRSLPCRSLLGWRWTLKTLRADFDTILRACGFETGRKHKFHKFRRTHATLLTEAKGLEFASKALGHASEQVTRESYVADRAKETSRAAQWMPVVTLGGGT